MTLEDANGLPRAAFVLALGWIFEQSPWVAEKVFNWRPFSSVRELHDGMMLAVERASREERLALLRAHPDLGSRARVSSASAGEQQSVGLDSLTADEFQILSDLNSLYKEKFGFPFLYAVKGSNKQDILLSLSLRLEATPEEEFHQALWEVSRIAWYRLQQMFGEEC